MSEEIKFDAFIAKAKSLGYSIFYGRVNSFNKPLFYWDNDQGDYIRFLKLGREFGIRILMVDRFVLYNEELDNMKLDLQEFSEKYRSEVQELNSKIEQFRKYAGKTGIATLSWVYEGAVFSYAESTDWNTDYYHFSQYLKDRVDEILSEEESESKETANS